jgi:hypothetical protein
MRRFSFAGVRTNREREKLKIFLSALAEGKQRGFSLFSSFSVPQTAI